MRAALRLLETSSPSSLLLLSAEKALDWMERWGGERLEWLAERISRLERELDGRYHLCRFTDMDPTRLVLDVRGTGNSGYAVADGWPKRAWTWRWPTICGWWAFPRS